MKRWVRITCAVFFVLMSIGCASGGSSFAQDYYNLGTGYLDRQEYAKAGDFFQRALELDPSLAQASYNLARVYVLLGQSQQAIAVLQDLLVQDPDNVMIRETLAFAYGSDGQWQAAADVMSAVVEDFEVSVRAWRNYALVLLQLEQWEDAYSAAWKAWDLSCLAGENEEGNDSDEEVVLPGGGDPISAYMLLVAAAHIDDRLADHEDLLAAAVASTPATLKEILALGDALEFAQRYDAAVELYDEVGASIDVDGEIAFRHARLLVEVVNDQDAAVAALIKAVSRGFVDQERLRPVLAKIDTVLPEELAEVQNSWNNSAE